MLGGEGTLPLLAQRFNPGDLLFDDGNKLKAQVVMVHDERATAVFQPRLETVRVMVQRGITNLTGKPTVTAAWRSLMSTQAVVGIKVYTAPGPLVGTRPEVVAAVIESLLEAGFPPIHIVVWDKQPGDLRTADFFRFTTNYGIRVVSSASAGYDEKTFYEPEAPVVGPLDPGDLNYGREKDVDVRRSHFTRLLTRQLTNIISIAPLLNHYHAGTAGHLYSIAQGSVDNFRRFESDAGRLREAVPEIWAQDPLHQRLVLAITDALLCQYIGQKDTLLHYSSTPNELWFSKDPVALDVLAIRELDRERSLAKMPAIAGNPELYKNATVIDLGESDLARIMVERFR